MNSKKIRTIGAVVLALLVLVYVGYQAYLATHRSIQDVYKRQALPPT